MSLPVPAEQTHLIHPKYRADIDGLRAIAVLFVIGFHAFPNWVAGGFVGVDIFFVISGFLISSIIISSLERGTFSFTEFYARRIKRIFPALILVMAACFSFGWFTLLADEYKQLGKHIAGGAGFISNFILWNESGYFDNAAETKPLLHLWSLGVEEQFYVIWPFFLWFAWKQRLNLLSIAITIGVISFVLNVYEVRNFMQSEAAFYSPQTRFWELMVGSVLACVTLHKQNAFLKLNNLLDAWLENIGYALKSNGKALPNVQSVVGAVLIVGSVLVINKETHFPGYWALLPTLGAVLLISAGAHAWLNRVVLSNRVLVWLGLISFPLYLWHWPLLSFARIVGGNSPSHEIRVAAVFISIGLAWLTYRLIERPFRFGNYNQAKAITLLVFMAVIGYTGYSCYARDGFGFREIAKGSLDLTNKKDYSGYARCQDGDKTLEWCIYKPIVQTSAALVGDSHAEDKFLGISKTDKRRNWMLIGNNSCPPVYGISVEIRHRDCEEKSENIIRALVQTRNIKTVALAFYGSYFLTTPYSADDFLAKSGPQDIIISSREFSSDSRANIFYRGLNNAIEILERNGKQVVLLIDVPELPFFPKDCIRNLNNQKCQLTRKEVDLRQHEQRLLVRKLQQQHPSLMVYDPIEMFCSQDICNFHVGNNIFYYDSHHLTSRGAELYGTHFIEWLDQLSSPQ
jgi:peptidoglycan/LPS O-acetylase OafA/YrhL